MGWSPPSSTAICCSSPATGRSANDGTLLYRGRVGAEVSPEEAYQAARATGIQLLRSIRDHLGDLDRVERIVKALGFVNSAPDFHDQPAVMHGFSDLMVDVFGAQRGQHAAERDRHLQSAEQSAGRDRDDRVDPHVMGSATVPCVPCHDLAHS